MRSSKTAVNTVYLFLCEPAFVCLEPMPKRSIAGSCSRCMLSFIRNCQTRRLNQCTFLPAMCEGSVSPHFHQHLVVSLFFILAFLIGVQRSLIVALAGASLVANGHEPLPMGQSAVCLPLLWRHVVAPFISSAHF